jgi:hypothetical protein
LFIDSFVVLSFIIKKPTVDIFISILPDIEPGWAGAIRICENDQVIGGRVCQ